MLSNIQGVVGSCSFCIDDLLWVRCGYSSYTRCRDSSKSNLCNTCVGTYPSNERINELKTFSLNRFVILKHVRRDLIQSLPLPQMLKQYLNTPYYYSEELALMSKEEPKPEINSEPERSLVPNTSQPIV